MNRYNFCRIVFFVLLSLVASLSSAQDDFDKLLKEIGAGSAATPPNDKAAVTQPRVSVEQHLSVEAATQTGDDKTKIKESRGDIKAALAEPDDKTVADAKLMAQQEEVRKQALEAQARKSLEKGTKALRTADYDNAIKLLEEAVRNMPHRPATEAVIDGAKATLGQAYLQKSDAILEFAKKKPAADALRDAETAKEFTEKARLQMPDSADVETMMNRIAATQSRLQLIITTRPPVSKRPEILTKKKTVAEFMSEGKEYYKAKDYDSAEAAFAEVLKTDEYNTDAMHYLRKISEIRYAAHSEQRDATVASMLDDVRKSWTPPTRTEVKLPVGGGTQTNILGSSTALQKKMDAMIIPEINFRQANITDVINFLVEASQQADPDKVGVNIILNLNIPGASTGATPDTADRTALPTGDLTASPADTAVAPSAIGSLNVPNITLSLRRTSLLNAVKYICEVAGLHYRLEENAVIITPANVVVGTVVTRLYPVQPSIVEMVVKKNEETAASAGGQRAGGGGGGQFVGMEGGNTSMQREDVRAFFEKAGVPFPAGTSITYNPTISKLIVANTPDNLEKLETILAALNLTPNQVEIEARFVELNQNDIQEFGLEWIFKNDWTLAQNTSGAPLGGAQSIVAKADSQGASKGMNFFHFDSNSGTIVPVTTVSAATGVTPMGNILTLAGVLTNPELSAVVHALDQHGAADLLSAPRVTTRSGVNAQIQVVREIIYPTEFESTQPQFSTGNGQSQVVTPPLVTPGSFETREVGVILNVTPTVGPDGYSIDLVLAPEVSELESWINYGSTFGTFTFNIPQPIFATRRVTTTIVIWDGQTVVMGGLIREALTKTKDKIPLLGDLPLIGRLFRVESEYSQKKNLLIFVTARLVDPAGKPIHSASSVGVETAPNAPETKS